MAFNYAEAPDSATQGTTAPLIAGTITRQIIPSITMWESEWVFLRAQYQWEKVQGLTSTSQFALQAVWAIGPHKHETY